MFPPKCSFCGKMDNIDKEIFVCKRCIGSLPFYKEEYRVCAKVIKKADIPFKNIDAVFCLFKYAGSVKRAFIRYKFQGDISVCKSFSVLMHRMLLSENAYSEIDYITSVPLSDERYAMRGFNQSYLIAKDLSGYSGIPYIEMLERPFQGVTQSKVSADERTHAKERFRVRDDIDIQGKTVLLVDDIITSGSTLDGCSMLLKDRGAALIKACAYASSRRDL